MGRKIAKKYYRFILRVNKELNPKTIEGIKRAIWSYLRDIPITDVHATKILKPQSLKFEEVIRC